MIRAVVVDDHPLIRETVRQYLETSADIECVGEAVDGHQAIEVVAEFKPDVVVMDLNLPVKDGASATYAITRSASAKVLVFSALETRQDALRAIQAGAQGYMTKRAPALEVLEAIRRVHRGEMVFGPDIAELLQVKKHSTAEDVRGLLERLKPTSNISGRELSVLQGVCRGLTNQEIAEELVLQPSTVNTYVARLNRKLGSHTRVGMYVAAVQQGVITSPFAAETTGNSCGQ